jgi:hypothetical protein
MKYIQIYSEELNFLAEQTAISFLATLTLGSNTAQIQKEKRKQQYHQNASKFFLNIIERFICERYTDMDHCQKCAQVCRCAEECHKI